MGITRKEFLRQGLFSLGRTALDLADTFKGVSASAAAAVIREADFQSKPRPDMVAESINESCLARNCGCFSCAERCESKAVLVVPGEGVRIDSALCNGCGTCEYVCPVSPKAVFLSPRVKT